MIRACIFAVALAVLVLAKTGKADDNATLIELPDGVLPLAVASGSTVVGGLTSGGGFYWMPTTGVVYMGGVQSLAENRNGRTIVGEAADAGGRNNAAIWQRAAEWRTLGSIVPNAQPCDTLLSTAIDTSADGGIIVGLAWNGCNYAHAFRWEESTGMVDLGSTVPDRSTRADGVSGDGKVVVGFQERVDGFWQGARWINGKQTLFDGPEGFVGQAFDVNADGSVVVGQVCRPSEVFDQSAWVWTSRDGMQCLPTPRVRTSSFIGKAYGTSDDGRVIVGGHSFGLESEAVIWIDKQPSYLKDYLRDHGVPRAFEDWVNTGALREITRDGRMMVGYGAGPRGFKGYIVILGAIGGN
jgi:probable HAF family extracellular repeat protein